MEPLIDHDEHGERKGEVLRQLGFSNCMQPTSVIVGSKNEHYHANGILYMFRMQNIVQKGRIYRNARTTSSTESIDNGTVQFNTMIVHKPKSTW